MSQGPVSEAVGTLEQRYDHAIERNMPSGDDLAPELEEFLRGQYDAGPHNDQETLKVFVV